MLFDYRNRECYLAVQWHFHNGYKGTTFSWFNKIYKVNIELCRCES